MTRHSDEDDDDDDAVEHFDAPETDELTAKRDIDAIQAPPMCVARSQSVSQKSHQRFDDVDVASFAVVGFNASSVDELDVEDVSIPLSRRSL